MESGSRTGWIRGGFQAFLANRPDVDPGIAWGAPITGGQHGGRRCPRLPIVGPSSGAAHSARSATSGSTLVARRAGIQHATIVTETSTTAIAMKVIGSVALTP